jgi:hypothetical protein
VKGEEMPGPAEQNRASSSDVSEQFALDIGTEAYVYGYPLVLMDVTRQVMTAVPEPDARKAPINQFLHLQSFPDDTFTDVVSPNADTLYSTAWLDLSQGPIVLSVPDMTKRYYVMQMLDAWTNVFASPGTRTTGSSKGDFCIVGPVSRGTLPDGVNVIKSPTSMVWLIGRTQTNGKDDYAAVHAAQSQYKLTPLSAWGREYRPPTDVPVDLSIDRKTPPVEQVAKMDASAFFTRLNRLMKNNPPAPADAGMIKEFKHLGIEPGKAFDLTSLDQGIARGLEMCVRAGQARILSEAKKPHGQKVNGWEFFRTIGKYGTDYDWRAVVSLIGLGANLPEDALYPRAVTDSDGQPLNGANRYVVHFPNGQLPPVSAFWSITMYNPRQLFVKNPINRFAIGDRDALTLNNDGSLTLYIQHDSPGKDKESNWLPAAEDAFNLMMRLYWPRKPILDGSWRPPAIRRDVVQLKRAA